MNPTANENQSALAELPTNRRDGDQLATLLPRDSLEHQDEEIDIEAVQREIDGIEAELAKTRQQMAVYLKELGYGE